MANIRYAVASQTLAPPAITTGGIAVLTSDFLELPSDNCRVGIIGFVQGTTAGGTTNMTPSICRGAAFGGLTVGAANAENLKAVAGSTESWVIMVVDNVVNTAVIQYSLCGLAGVANITTIFASIFCFVL